MTFPTEPDAPWPWLELDLVPSIERYVRGLEAERDTLRGQTRYMRQQLAALGGP